MCCSGGGDVNFPSPYEVGHAQTQFNWQDQYTPYGGLVYDRPELVYNEETGQYGASGNAAAYQFLNPNLLQQQGAMMGVRNAALAQLLGRFGGESVPFSNPQMPEGMQVGPGYTGGGGVPDGKPPIVQQQSMAKQGPQSLGLGVGEMGGGGREVAYIDEQGRPRSQGGWLVNPRGGDQVAPAQRDFSQQEGFGDQADWYSDAGMEAGKFYDWSQEGGIQEMSGVNPAGSGVSGYGGPYVSENVRMHGGVDVPDWALLEAGSHTDPRMKFPGYGGRDPGAGAAGGSRSQQMAKVQPGYDPYAPVGDETQEEATVRAKSRMARGPGGRGPGDVVIDNETGEVISGDRGTPGITDTESFYGYHPVTGEPLTEPLDRDPQPIGGHDPGGEAAGFRPDWLYGSEGYDPIEGVEQQAMPDLPYNLDIGNLPGISPTSLMAGARGKMEDTIYGRATSRLDPQFAQREKAMRDMLVNRGLTEGSEIWNQELGNLGRERSDAYGLAQSSARMGAGEEMQRQLGMEMTRRNQPLQERLAQLGASSSARGQLFGEDTTKYNQLASILGLTAAPGAGGDIGQFWGPSPVDMMGAFNSQMQGQMYNQQAGGDILSGLLGLGGQLGGAYLGRG